MTSYPFSDEEYAKVQNTFSYHPVINDQESRYHQLREKLKELTLLYLSVCPPSRERSVALTELETSGNWAIKSIAINEKSGE